MTILENILTINESCYSTGTFTFDTSNPNSCVTFLQGYENCSLTCIAESNLCVALSDYNFAVIPGNTALTGLGEDYASKIVLSEIADEYGVSRNAVFDQIKKTISILEKYESHLHQLRNKELLIKASESEDINEIKKIISQII